MISSDISDLDKALMCYNMAVVEEQLGREQQALGSYDRGISYERIHSRSFVAEHKAGYLSRLGRHQEGLRLYEELLLRRALMEEEKTRISQNIKLLREQSDPGIA